MFLNLRLDFQGALRRDSFFFFTGSSRLFFIWDKIMRTGRGIFKMFSDISVTQKWFFQPDLILLNMINTRANARRPVAYVHLLDLL